MVCLFSSFSRSQIRSTPFTLLIFFTSLRQWISWIDFRNSSCFYFLVFSSFIWLLALITFSIWPSSPAKVLLFFFFHLFLPLRMVNVLKPVVVLSLLSFSKASSHSKPRNALLSYLSHSQSWLSMESCIAFSGLIQQIPPNRRFPSINIIIISHSSLYMVIHILLYTLSHIPNQQHTMSDEVQELYLSEIFNRVCLILQAHQHTAFTIIKANYQASLTNKQTSAFVFQAILNHIVNRTKKILFNHIQNISESGGFWQAKATVLMLGILSKKMKNPLSQAFDRIRDGGGSQGRMESMARVLTSIVRMMGRKVGRNKRVAFSNMGVYEAIKKGNKKGVQLGHGSRTENTIRIGDVLQRLILQRYQQPMLLMGKHNKLGQDDTIINAIGIKQGHEEMEQGYQQEQQQEQEQGQQQGQGQQQQEQEQEQQQQEQGQDSNMIKVQAFKTAIVSLNKMMRKKSPSDWNRKQQLAGASLMEGVLRKRLEHSVGQCLGRMVWRGVCEMDSDMIDKLETEIDVLQHEFDSL